MTCLKRSLFLSGLLVSSLFAQELVTDRPDFTESALVVPYRSLQVEMGGGHEKHAGQTAWHYPNMLARIGIFNKIELRLGLPGWINQNSAAHSATFFQDVFVEGKFQLSDPDAALPMALILGATIPSGHAAVSSGKSDVGGKFCAALDLAENVGLSANLGLFSIGNSAQRRLTGLASLSCGFGITDKLGFFLETFAEMPEQEVWSPAVDAGITYLLAPLLQVDATLGFGLNDLAAERFGGFGLCFRL